MQSALYVNLSAQVALEQRLNTVASNVANLATTGYRAEEVKFETILSRAGGTWPSRRRARPSCRAGPAL